DMVESLTTAGFPRTYATGGYCWASPLTAARRSASPDTPCGQVTPHGGLDDFSGNQLSRAPKWTVTLSAGYGIPVGRFGTLTPRVQETWRGDPYLRAFNREFDLQEAYHLTDAKLEWRSPEERWEAE